MPAYQPTRSHNRGGSILPLALLVLAATLSMGAKRCEHERTAQDCVQDGNHFEVGESFPSSDGCNTCNCQAEGRIACTLKACLPEGSCGAKTCAADEFCWSPPTETCNSLAGRCDPRPEACDAIYDPICGCDGETYSSECAAAMSGVAVATTGECDGDRPDGGADSGCDYDGVHHDVGSSFPSDDGCNTCSCTEGGAVACTKRACLPAGTCGGLLGGSCPKDEYCAFPEDALCGAADATGRCTKRPDVCTDNFNPVCGCDDKTYGNACEAAAAGVSVASMGECAGAGTGGSTCKLGDTEFDQGEGVICSDGCNQCACDGQDRWISTLALCGPLARAELCSGVPDPSSGLNVTPLYRDDDALALAVQYGGGCFPHTFKLCYSDAFAESSPVQASLWLVDTTDQVDSCLALPTQEVVFDLTPLREAYIETYPGGPNTLLLNLDRQQVTYSF